MLDITYYLAKIALDGADLFLSIFSNHDGDYQIT